MSKRSITVFFVTVFLIIFGGFSITQAAEPVYKTGLEFNGSNSYVILSKPYEGIPNTFEAWIKVPTALPDDTRVGIIIGSYSKARGQNNVNFEVHQTGDPRIWWNDGEVQVRAEDFDVRTGEWLHFAVVRDMSERRGSFIFYINGEEIYRWRMGAGTDVIPVEPPNIGSDRRLSDGPVFNGRIGELRVWSTARTQQQIKDNMNVELTGNEDGLLAYWKFDEGSGDTLHDSTPYANHGVIEGATWYSED